MKLTQLICIITILHILGACSVQPQTQNAIIHNGIPWFDDRDSIVNAHGTCIVEDGGRYYLFGEYKSNGINAFYGFSCYSSDDLVNWKFERIVFGVQPDGILGPNRVGERVKVMKCPSTEEYVMYMHCDDMKYMDACTGYATSPTVNGEYTFHGPLLYNGEPIRRWDMGTFQDTDGTGYLLIHHGIIYRLSDDYRSAEAKVLDRLPGSGESPAMLKKDGLYYLLYSRLTSWERNDNFYYTAPFIEGPWTYRGLFTPEGSLTYNSQCSFVFPMVNGNDTVHLYMGDRWSFPHQSDAATQVWLPLQTGNGNLSIPDYWEAWNPVTMQSADPLAGGKPIGKPFVSNDKNSYLEIPFQGVRVAVTGETNASGGYAKISIFDADGKTLQSSFVDFYSKMPHEGVRYISPTLPNGNYTLRIEVTGIIPEWFQKNGKRFGSSNCFVTINNIFSFQH